jgi:hypothetical protein
MLVLNIKHDGNRSLNVVVDETAVDMSDNEKIRTYVNDLYYSDIKKIESVNDLLMPEIIESELKYKSGNLKEII